MPEANLGGQAHAAKERAAGEDLHVPDLVGGLRGEELQDLAEVGVDLPGEARRFSRFAHASGSVGECWLHVVAACPFAHETSWRPTS